MPICLQIPNFYINLQQPLKPIKQYGSGRVFLGTVNLLHMNWGMDGKGDGYFMCDALNPYDRWIPDVNTDTGKDSQYILPSIFFFDIQTL